MQAGADGIGSSVVGGLISAGAVMLGAWLAYLYGQKMKKDESRRVAGNALIIEISDLRDAAVHSREGSRGSYPLYPLRNRLFLSQEPLKGLPSLQMADEFYKAVRRLRDWVRHNSPEPLDQWSNAKRQSFADYQTELSRLADKVIKILQESLTDRDAILDKPQLPDLPE